MFNFRRSRRCEGRRVLHDLPLRLPEWWQFPGAGASDSRPRHGHGADKRRNTRVPSSYSGQRKYVLRMRVSTLNVMLEKLKCEGPAPGFYVVYLVLCSCDYNMRVEGVLLQICVYLHCSQFERFHPRRVQMIDRFPNKIDWNNTDVSRCLPFQHTWEQNSLHKLLYWHFWADEHAPSL